MNPHPLRFVLGVAVTALCSMGLRAQEMVAGVYQIGTVADLQAFSARVNAGENTANACLNASIDLAGTSHTPIGNDEHPYMGNFDGRGHSIMNMQVKGKNGAPCQGFFGVIGGRCEIENLIIASGRVQGYRACGGVAGAVRGNAGSVVRITNCGNNAYITTTAENAAGILGCNYDSNTIVYITNCYNTASISGARESAAICGWMGERRASQLVNCYNAGRIQGMDANRNLCRSSEDRAQIVNCYDVAVGISKTQGDKSVKFTEVPKGVLCHRLGEPYTQELGVERYPTFGSRAVTTVTPGVYINEGDTVPSLDIVDGQTQLGLSAPCVLDMVRYTRHFAQAGEWEPLFVPFDSQVDDWQGLTIAQFHDIRLDRGEIEFTLLPPGAEVKHCTPYIAMATEPCTVEVHTTQPTDYAPQTDPLWCASTHLFFHLNGTMSDFAISPYLQAILANGQLATTSTEATQPALRWHLSTQDKATEQLLQSPRLAISILTPATGILSVTQSTHAASPLYHLNGQKAQPGAHGILVQNGQKWLRK